jgi:tetratricopeptide (TPR) repeat protein
VRAWARWLLSVALLCVVAIAVWGSRAEYSASRLSERAGREVQAGQLDLAAAELRQALSLRPNDPELLRLASTFSGTLAFFQSGNSWQKQAIASARQAALHGRRDARNFAALGWAMQDAGHSLEAELAFRAALERDPHNQADLYALGLLYETTGRTALALRQYRAALDVRPDAVLEAALMRLGASP